MVILVVGIITSRYEQKLAVQQARLEQADQIIDYLDAGEEADQATIERFKGENAMLRAQLSRMHDRVRERDDQLLTLSRQKEVSILLEFVIKPALMRAPSSSFESPPITWQLKVELPSTP